MKAEGADLEKLIPKGYFLLWEATQNPLTTDSVSFLETCVVCNSVVAGEGKGKVRCDFAVNLTCGEAALHVLWSDSTARKDIQQVVCPPANLTEVVVAC